MLETAQALCSMLQEDKDRAGRSRPAFCIAILVMVSSVSSDHPLNELDEEPGVSNRTCFVPPSERPRDVDELALMYNLSFTFVSEVVLDHLVFPNGTCGLDFYFYAQYRYFDVAFKAIIEIEQCKVNEYCSYSDESTLSQPWQLKILTTGTGPGQPSQKLVPDEELTRLPDHWLNGLVALAHTDYLAPGPQTIRCKLPYLSQVSQSSYNFNVTFEVNGCPSGRYGGQCDQYCSCAEGVECHAFTGACVCPRGLQGTRCDERDPQLTVQLKQMYVPYGETFNLTCTAYGMLPSLWSWTKDGQATPLMTIPRKEMTPYKPRPVVITAAIEAESTSVNGGYVCEVYDENGAAYRQHVIVTVIAILDPFTGLPKDQTVLIGNNATFICKAKVGTGRVRWVRGRNVPSSEGAEITDRIGRYEIRQPSVGVSELHIYGVEFEDEGVYRCFVGHTFRGPDLQYAEANLTVQSDPQPDCSFQGVITAQSGHSLTLQCLLQQAKPVPAITWSTEDREPTPEPVTTITLSDDNHSWNLNTSMTFVPAPEDDGKRVSVTMVSPAWMATREITSLLNVTYSPIVSISPNPITLTVGQDATITCEAEANPEPTSYVWTLGHPNKPVSNDAHSKGPAYFIKNVGKEYDKANLTCLVQNTIGETQMAVLIKVKGSGISAGAKIAFSVSGGLCLAVLLLASILARCYRKEITLWWAKRAGQKDKGRKKFDVFISYKSGTPDEEFVVGELIPRLEQDGYRVCVHYRYFMPGRSIIDNICDAVHCSRKTLLVLSPGFVESEWCRYEFQAALSEMLHLQTDLIPVIFEDLGPPENLTEDLKTMLRTLSYITWPGAILHGQYQTEEDKERFWNLLWKSLPGTPLGLEEPTPENDLEMERRSASEEDTGDETLLISV